MKENPLRVLLVEDSAGDARLLGRGDEAFRQRIVIVVTRDENRPVRAAERGIAMRVLFHALKIGQHPVQVPAGIAEAFSGLLARANKG